MALGRCSVTAGGRLIRVARPFAGRSVHFGEATITITCNAVEHLNVAANGSLLGTFTQTGAIAAVLDAGGPQAADASRTGEVQQ